MAAAANHRCAIFKLYAEIQISNPRDDHSAFQYFAEIAETSVSKKGDYIKEEASTRLHWRVMSLDIGWLMSTTCLKNLGFSMSSKRTAAKAGLPHMGHILNKPTWDLKTGEGKSALLEASFKYHQKKRYSSFHLEICFYWRPIRLEVWTQNPLAFFVAEDVINLEGKRALLKGFNVTTLHRLAEETGSLFNRWYFPALKYALPWTAPLRQKSVDVISSRSTYWYVALQTQTVLPFFTLYRYFWNMDHRRFQRQSISREHSFTSEFWNLSGSCEICRVWVRLFASNSHIPYLLLSVLKHFRYITILTLVILRRTFWGYHKYEAEKTRQTGTELGQSLKKGQKKGLGETIFF